MLSTGGMTRKSSRRSSCREMLSGSSTPSRLSSRWRVGALHSHHSKSDECPFKGAGPRRRETRHSHVRVGVHSQWQSSTKGVRRPKRPRGFYTKSPFSATVWYYTAAWCFQKGRRLLPSVVSTSSVVIRCFLHGASGSTSILLVCKKGSNGQDQQLTSRLDTSSLR